jgi:ABC-2 type transport system ATP-binding protein
MRDAVREGSAILFSSHVLGDVEDVADRVAIIDRGRVRKIAGLSELTDAADRLLIRLAPEKIHAPETVDPAYLEKIKAATANCNVSDVKLNDGLLTCIIKNVDAVPDLVRSLALSGYRIYEVQHEKNSLEDVFLREFGELPVDRTHEVQNTGSQPVNH